MPDPAPVADIVDPHTAELHTLEAEYGFERAVGYEHQISAGHHDTGALNAAQAHDGDIEPTTVALSVVGGAESVVVEPDTLALPTLPERIPTRSKVALVVLAACAFATATNEASIVALSPLIAAGLDVPIASIGLLATAFALTIVLTALPLTLATGRIGKRTTLASTLVLWTGGVIVAATATTFAQLAAGRVVTAIAHGLFWAIMAPTAASLFPSHMRAATVTKVMVGGAVAGVIGTPLVTLAGEHVGWQAPYWALAGLGALLAIALVAAMPATRRADRSAPREHIVGDLPSRPAFVRILAVGFTVTVAMSATWTYIVPIYTADAGLDIGLVPVLFSVGGVVAVATTLIISRFLARFVARAVTLGLLAIAAAFGLLLTQAVPGAAVAQVAQSAGWAMLVAALLNWAMRHTPWRTDIGASIYTVTVNAGGALGPVVGSVVVSAWGTDALPLVSLGLTAVAGVIAAGFDARTLRRLEVPRRVRMAVAARFVQLERHELNRRMVSTLAAPLVAARLVSRHAGRVGKGVTRVSTRRRP